MERLLYISNFKYTFIFILKIILFCGVLLPMVLWLGKTFKATSKENLINEFNRQRFEDFYKEENDADVVFLGSSHAYCTFDPEIFDRELGVNSYNMGMPLQLPVSTYYELKDILSRQKPKTVIMEVYWGVLDTGFQINQVNQLFQVMDNDEVKAEYRKEAFPLGEKIKDNVDMLKYQSDYYAFKSDEYNKRFKSRFGVTEPVSEKQTGEERYGGKGFVYCTYNMIESEYNTTNQFVGMDGNNFKTNSTQMKYMQKICDLLKDEGIRLIFVTAPVAPVSMEYIKNYDKINAVVKDFADRNNIEYFDYNIINREENLVGNENFRDDAHLNYSGVEIIDSHFINLLKEKGIELK